MRHMILCLLVLLDKDIILAALHKARIQTSKMKLHADVDPRLFARQLDGEGKLDHGTLLKLPASFMRWYALLMLERVGLPEEVTRAKPVMRALRARRMARMALARERRERTA